MSVVADKGKIDGMIAAYLHAVTHANREIIEEIVKMTNVNEMPKFLEEALIEAGLFARWEVKNKEKVKLIIFSQAFPQRFNCIAYCKDFSVVIMLLCKER